MKYPSIQFSKEQAFSLERFREMDYHAVNNFHLPIELMMENAGLQLANFVAHQASIEQTILIGVGNGNNGGGGLVAARRLAAWGYSVFIDSFTEITKEIPKSQLQRAIKFGAKVGIITKPNIWVDAYLGFSQKLPLRPALTDRLNKANSTTAIKISLDIPTGFLGNIQSPYFHANQVLTLAAPKSLLYQLPASTSIYIADIGIPKEVYALFGSKSLPFFKSNILSLNT